VTKKWEIQIPDTFTPLAMLAKHTHNIWSVVFGLTQIPKYTTLAKLGKF
jgi:hypothetical protein